MSPSIVVKVVARYYSWYHDPEELESVGLMGLASAYRDYDGRGAFDTFAWYRVRGELSNFMRRQRNVVSLADDMIGRSVIRWRELLTDDQLSVVELYYITGLTMVQVADSLSVSVSEVSAVLKELKGMDLCGY
jgi:DNA-directed RNA polymerase specialized sigma subunit